MQGEAVPVYPGGGWRWPRRPLLSLLVRALAFGVPVAIAVITGLVVLAVSSRDGAPVLLFLGLLDLAVACAVALLAFAALGERALTLAALLDISMQFPYRPSLAAVDRPAHGQPPAATGRAEARSRGAPLGRRRPADRDGGLGRRHAQPRPR